MRFLDLDELYDFVWQSFRPRPSSKVPSEAINTLGEVPDSEWFTNRHARSRMSPDQLRRGPGNENPPVPPFVVVDAKSEGITPGFTMEDSRRRRYFVKVDPLTNPEMASAADVIGSKAFFALGYNTPENYIVNLRREDLSVEEDAEIEVQGRERRMSENDLELLLDNVPRRKDGTYRILASLAVAGQPIGPFRYDGTRSDDPNDIVPHERRRDLRGLSVFAAWLNHTDSKGGNSLDVVVEENGVRFVRHFLIDFGAILGSDTDKEKNATYGHEYVFPEAGKALKAMAALGFYSPDWERIDYPDHDAVGRFSAEGFDPETWTSNYPNPAFLNRLPGDEYWAAKQIMAFRDSDIRALVETGEYSDPAAVDYVVSTLAKRRDIIGRTYFRKVLPLENFRLEDGELTFDDLGARYGFLVRQPYRLQWSTFNNESGTRTALPAETTSRIPAAAETGSYLSVDITAMDGRSMTVYIRKSATGWEVVGIDRENGLP
jgi:hypothetical protein